MAIDLRDLAAAIQVRHGLDKHSALHAATMLRDFPSLSISSGRRTPARNARVGGVANSWHLHGRAADFVGPLVDLRSAAQHAFRQRVSPRCTGPEEVLLERAGEPGQHLHVAW